MAINFTSFLGGLGEGFDAYGKERRLRQADVRAQQREDLAERRVDELGAKNIYDRIAQITKDDALDEQETLKRLRLPTIDSVAKQQEMEARRQRHENAKLTISQLSGQPGVTKMFGNTAQLLRPSMVAGPGFQMPAPEVDPTRAFDLLQKERTRIEGITTPGANKEALVAQSRKGLEGLVPKEMLDRILPAYGSSLGYGTPTSPAKALENPEQFFAQNKDFTQGTGGERVLPTGARQRVFYKDGNPMVEYAPELKATYESPEISAARVKLTSEQARRLEGLYAPTIRKAEADASLSEWKGKLAGKQYEWFDRVQGAKVHKDMIAKSGSGASDALRRMSILLSHQDRVAGLEQRDRQFGQMMGVRNAGLSLQSQALLQKAQADFNSNMLNLNRAVTAARAAAGKAKDFGMGASQKAAMDSLAGLEPMLQKMQSQYQALSAGDTQLAGQLAGVGGNTASMDIGALMAQPQGGTGGLDPAMLMQIMAQGGFGGGGQQQVQQPAQPSVVFSPQIFAGGQPGMGGMAGMPGMGGGTDQNAILQAITNMLMQRGVIQRGTDDKGKFIPAGSPGSVFQSIPQMTRRVGQIRSSLNLLHTPDSIIQELAYKYPNGFPAGPEGELIKQNLLATDKRAARMAPSIKQRNDMEFENRERERKASEKASADYPAFVP